ncbi:trypsin 3A1-like [Eurosta solidaginis]|uniref:trypsin 3A1-like n=1 Tax=Eurosta solidaginis TaxID=178769 RepID=UPI00353069AD
MMRKTAYRDSRIISNIKYIVYKMITWVFCSIIVSVTAHPAADLYSPANNTTKQLETRYGRIVGGNEASIHRFPYQVSIQLEGAHRCGGAIYTPKIIISAAHCLKLPDMPELYAVRAGSTEHEQGGQYIPVRNIYLHSQFQKPNLRSNDIALLWLQLPLQFDYNTQPIPLGTKTDIADISKKKAFLVVSGWGATAEETQVGATRLRYAEVQMFNQNYCKTALAGKEPITGRMLCAGALGGGRDSCKGDSGGPLVSYSRGQAILVGIVSFGVGCGRTKYPGVYTRVAEYKDWIEKAAKKM